MVEDLAPVNVANDLTAPSHGHSSATQVWNDVDAIAPVSNALGLLVLVVLVWLCLHAFKFAGRPI